MKAEMPAAASADAVPLARSASRTARACVAATASTACRATRPTSRFSTRTMASASRWTSTLNRRISCGCGTRSSRPCLDVVAPQKNNYSPLEVCHIFAGQKCARKPTDKQVANTIRFTCTPRDQRDRAEAARVGFPHGPDAARVYLQVDPRMVETTGRRQSPPMIVYSGGARENPRDGAWNMRGERFHAPAKCNRIRTRTCT